MSHFTVLVVGDNVEDQLQPFHEFECTGDNDKYVLDIDITEDARSEFGSETVKRLRDPEGKTHSWYDADGNFDVKFLREPTAEEALKLSGSGCDGDMMWVSRDWEDGRGYRSMIVEKPEGWVEVDVNTSETQTFAEFVVDYHGAKPVPYGEIPDIEGEHKFGYYTVDENGEVDKVFRRTNPNRHWDWYQVGGRWSGFFQLKPNADGVLGTPSLLSRLDPDFVSPDGTKADQAMKGDIDFDAMRNVAGEEAGAKYDKIRAILDPHPFVIPWKDIYAEVNAGDIDIDSARIRYNRQDGVMALRDSAENSFWDKAEDYQISREQYVQNARNAAVATFAIVKDGTWYERGSMGWWGCVSDEKDKDEWHTQYAQLLDDLSDNTLLTVVDCHI